MLGAHLRKDLDLGFQPQMFRNGARMAISFVSAFLIFTLVLASFAKTVNNIKKIEPVYLPRGVASLPDQMAFIANFQGGIDALTLSDGRLLWHTNAASVPLLADEGRLFAYTISSDDVIKIIVLNTKNKGAVIRESAPIRLLEGENKIGSPGQSLEMEATLQGDRMLARWRVRSIYDGGAPPPDDVRTKLSKEFSGI